MKRASRSSTAPIDTCDIGAVVERIEATRLALREALLAGEPTAAMRRELTDLEASLARVRADMSAAAAEEAGRHDAEMAARASSLIAEARTQIDHQLAALQPPPSPEVTQGEV